MSEGGSDKPVFRPGKFVRLVPYRAEHAEKLCAWYYDPDYRFFFRDFLQNLDLERFRKLGDDMAHSGVHLITILDAPTGEPIGLMTLLLEKRSARIFKFGIMLEHGYQGRSWAIEAIIILADYVFGKRGGRKYVVEFCTEDAHIRRITEKGGFTHEATFREEIFVDGKYHDEARYALSVEAYRERYSGYLDSIG